MDKATIQRLKAIAEARGFKQVPDDHWIYSEGASSILVSEHSGGNDHEGVAQLLQPETSSLTKALMKALRTAQMDHEPVSADDVSNLIELKTGQTVNWVSSTWLEPQMVNLYACGVEGEKSTYIGTRHGDGGVLESIDGPWQTLEDAKASYEDVPEGWSDL